MALAIAGITGAVAARWSGFAASISDPSGYVGAAEGLWDGALTRPVSLALAPVVIATNANSSPIGYRPGLATGTVVPVYPLGLAYLMVAARWVAGGHPLAVHLVCPAMFGVLVLLAFLLTRPIGGDGLAIAAALATALNPVALLNSVVAMSDVAAAACWFSAWHFALRGTRSAAVVSGAIAALATTIRPNLAPLALVPAALVLVGPAAVPARRWRWSQTIGFGLVAAVGPLLVAWSQLVLYGGAMRPGYPGWESFYRTAHLTASATTYPRLLVDGYGWFLWVAFGLTLLVARRFSSPRQRIVWSGSAIFVINLALYAWYLPYDKWPFLRFFLPGTAAVLVVGLGGVAWGLGKLGGLARPIGVALVVAFVAMGAWQNRARL